MNSEAPEIFRKHLRLRGFSAWEAATEFGRGRNFPQAIVIARLLGALLAIVALAVSPTAAWAQQGSAVVPLPPAGSSGYLIVPSPGSNQHITTVLPIPGGAYLIQQEGQPSTVVLPLPGGGASTSPSWSK
jgi:hypothetical protein